MKFSRSWKSSKKPSKQRKYRENAPLHIRQKFMSVHLSPELREKHGKRNISVRKGDKVKVMRGNFKDHEGKVNTVDRNYIRVYVQGAEVTKKDGTKSQFPIHPSNLMITELKLDDKKRKQSLER